MPFLLPLAAASPDLAQSIADPAQRRAAETCVPALSRKAGGEISTLDVSRLRRVGRDTILSGAIRVFQKPVARPGEMTPTHVVVLNYSYECRLRGRRAPRIKLNPLDG